LDAADTLAWFVENSLRHPWFQYETTTGENMRGEDPCWYLREAVIGLLVGVVFFFKSTEVDNFTKCLADIASVRRSPGHIGARYGSSTTAALVQLVERAFNGDNIIDELLDYSARDGLDPLIETTSVLLDKLAPDLPYPWQIEAVIEDASRFQRLKAKGLVGSLED